MIVEFSWWDAERPDYACGFTWLDARDVPVMGDAVMEPDGEHLRLVVGREWVRVDQCRVELSREQYKRRLP